MKNTLNLKMKNVFTSLAVLSGLSSCDSKVVFSDRVVAEDSWSATHDADSAESDSGSGLHRKVDNFTQAARSKIDVLWVIDNSASMEEYQDKLSINIGTFLDQISTWNADLQMAVTSTDMCTELRPKDLTQVMCPDKARTTAGLRGKIAGNTVISGVDGDARFKFSELVKLGTGGSSFEHGLSAAKKSVELSLAGDNFGLVREHSFLAVVLVSDEEDDGVGLSRVDEKGTNWTTLGRTRYNFSAKNLVSYLSSVKPDGQFSVSSIVNFVPQMHRGRGRSILKKHEVGAEQLSASTLSGGFKLDIASDDWATGLSNLADNFSNQLSSFKLSIVPAPQTPIEVSVNGQVMNGGWSYIEDRQSIVFESGHIPVFDSHIEVSYQF